MIKLESSSNPISFGQANVTFTPPVNPDFIPPPPPFEVQQVPIRVTDLPLPLSLSPGRPADMSDSSRNFRGMIGIGVALLIIFLLRG